MGRMPSKRFSYGLKWGGKTLIQHNTGNHQKGLERRKKCRLVCWELLDIAAQDKVQFWSVVYLCKSPTRSILSSRWELGSVLCDDQEGWEGVSRGRGYMDNYAGFTLLYGRNQLLHLKKKLLKFFLNNNKKEAKLTHQFTLFGLLSF